MQMASRAQFAAASCAPNSLFLSARNSERVKASGLRFRSGASTRKMRFAALSATVAGMSAALLSLAVHAQAIDPRFRIFDGIDGATCVYFNGGARIPWRHALGDWSDADGHAQGSKPFSTAVARAGIGKLVVGWDVTALVSGWLSGRYPNTGLLLATADVEPSGTIAFSSREAVAVPLRPRLTVHIAGEAEPRTLVPVADASLDCSTRRSLGDAQDLRVGGGVHTIMQFDLSSLEGRRISVAVLELVTAGRHSSAATIGVFRLDPPMPSPEVDPVSGLSRRHPGDRGIAKDPDVLMATSFESPTWRAQWSFVSPTSHVDIVDRDDKRNFQQLLGKALRVEIRKGDNYGLDMGFDFKSRLGYEPEEVYFRYYLRLGDDFVPTADGGKLPGLAGTYGQVGWGGRRADPLKGWSMRGSFSRAPTPANPFHDTITIGTYAYHADMEDKFGDEWYWTRDQRGVLERNRWYCLEQYFKVNTPGERDGVLRAWIDGAPAFEKTDIRVRDVNSLKIERVWMDVFYGGTDPAPRDMHLYIDAVVVARKPIGCIAGH